MIGQTIAHYRVLQLLGGGGARAQYQRFAELWKNADPGLTELDEVRRKLKR